MEVRPATLRDCPAIARGMKVVVDEGRWLATEPSTPVADLEERFRATVEWDGHVLLVLEEDGEIVGAIGLHPTPVDGVLSLGMWVLPNRRQEGGGRMMLDAVLDRVPAGAHKLELEVFPDNESAIALYERSGFEREGLRRDHYRREDGTLRSALLMSRLYADGAG